MVEEELSTIIARIAKNLEPSFERRDRFFESYFAKSAIEALSPPASVQKFLKEVRNPLFQISDDFEWIIVSGRSRLLMRSILEATGVDSSKIIEFNDQENAEVYKIDTPEHEAMTEEERLAAFRRNLAKSRLGETPSSLLVADEFCSSASKAYAYINTLSQMSEIRRYAFCSLVTEEKEANPGPVNYFQLLQEQLGANYSKIFIELHKTTTLTLNEQQEVYLYFMKLSDLLSNLDDSHALNKYVPQEILPLLRSACSLAIKNLSELIKQ